MHGIQLPGVTCCQVCGFCDAPRPVGEPCRACGVAVDNRTAIKPIVLAQVPEVEDSVADTEFEPGVPQDRKHQMDALFALGRK